ncbi:TRIM2 [Branchiostoma lanceolatum]|uniref:TRIM2 protein n=1 Tax=Branchiostoma lanceolatum TaxID=7740 RepID=A0A8K0AGF5_BRALA|nr:TRIM2 [Branchiostoma lanceolatum]
MAEKVRKKSLTNSIAGSIRESLAGSKRGSLSGSVTGLSAAGPITEETTAADAKAAEANAGTAEGNATTQEADTTQQAEVDAASQDGGKVRRKSLTQSIAGSIRESLAGSRRGSKAGSIKETPEADTEGNTVTAEVHASSEEASTERKKSLTQSIAGSVRGSQAGSRRGSKAESITGTPGVDIAVATTGRKNSLTQSILGSIRSLVGSKRGSLKEIPEEIPPEPEEPPPIKFGGRNTRVKDKFRCVSGLAVSKESEIYIADCYNERIVIYSTEGKFIREFPTAMKGLLKPVPFQPEDVTIDKYEKVWVVGSLAIPKKRGATDFVVQFTKEGLFISKIEIPHTGKESWHGIAAKPNNLFHKEVIKTDDDDDLPPKPDMEIIVTEQRVRLWEGKWYVESCAKLFLPDGTMHRTTAGRTRKARYAAVNSRGDILVSDCWTHRVHTFKDEDKPSRFGTLGTANGCLDAPHGVCTDSEDNVIVVDRGNKRVELFDRDGNFIRHIAEDMADPWAVAVGPDFVVVTNVGNCGVDEVTVIQYTPPPAPPEPENEDRRSSIQQQVRFAPSVSNYSGKDGSQRN